MALNKIILLEKLILSIVLLCFTLTAIAQQDSLQNIPLKSVDITVSKLSTEQKKLPLSVTIIDALEIQPVAQQLSFQEYLQDVPGLFSLNANNYSQDLRLSIRGFGARSAFGIRGIKIIVDGIPETTPDGQGQIDNLNLAVIKSIEVLRGPSSVLYGNASGGVINISTIDTFEKDFVQAGYTFGSFNLKQANVMAGFQQKNTTYILQGNYTETDGYRDQSGFLNYNFNGKVKHQFSETSQLTFNLNYTDSPVAEDAGGLTLEEAEADRRQARQRNVDFQTEEAIQQFKLGLAFDSEVSENLDFNTYGFYSFRNFYGVLPFENGGIVDLGRDYFGQGSSLTFNRDFPEFKIGKTKGLDLKIQLGYDIAFQRDERLRFQNEQGVQGDESLNQLEKFDTFGVYLLKQAEIGNWLFRGGLRYDYNLLEAEDNFLSDGDDSGDLQLNAFSANFNSSYELNEVMSLFGGISTSFETPALSELSANPNGDAGFNQNLEAQRAVNYEIGLKAKTDIKRLELTVFYIDTQDDLVPFELEAFPDRTFFRNAGSTSRFGAELFLSQQLTDYLKLNTSYTYSNFEYDDYELPSGDFSGNDLPGIPKHIATASLLYQKNALTLQLNAQYTGDFFADDTNETTIDNYVVVNLKSGYRFKRKQFTLSPFFGINNLFDEQYYDNVRLNAFGNRFYEPAPGFNVYLGLNFQL